MRISSFKTVLLMVSALGLAPAAIAGTQGSHYQVELNKTQVLRLSEPAAAIVIGNPEIADVSVHSSDTVFIVGRGYGETNIVVLNNAGQTVMDADIQVTNTISKDGLRLFKGGDRNSYSCAPYCLPAPILGDDPGFVDRHTQEGQEINNDIASSGMIASSSAGPSGPPTSGATRSSEFAPN